MRHPHATPSRKRPNSYRFRPQQAPPSHAGATAATFVTLLMEMFAGTVRQVISQEFDVFMDTLGNAMLDDGAVGSPMEDRKRSKRRNKVKRLNTKPSSSLSSPPSPPPPPSSQASTSTALTPDSNEEASMLIVDGYMLDQQDDE